LFVFVFGSKLKRIFVRTALFHGSCIDDPFKLIRSPRLDGRDPRADKKTWFDACYEALHREPMLHKESSILGWDELLHTTVLSRSSDADHLCSCSSNYLTSRQEEEALGNALAPRAA